MNRSLARGLNVSQTIVMLMELYAHKYYPEPFVDGRPNVCFPLRTRIFRKPRKKGWDDFGNTIGPGIK